MSKINCLAEDGHSWKPLTFGVLRLNSSRSINICGPTEWTALPKLHPKLAPWMEGMLLYVAVSHHFQLYLIWSPYEPYNLGWYVSVMILYVFSILKLAGGGLLCKILIVFLFHALYIFCLIYITWILTCSITFGLWPHVLGLNK
jgi:hypothetical protein